MTKHAGAVIAHVELPDGTDLTDAKVQKRVDVRARQRYGQGAVVAWPRHPDVQDGIAPLVPILQARPGARRLPLESAAKAAKLAARCEGWGLTLVAYDEHRREAVVAQLDADTLRVRNRLASLLKCEPWAVEVVCHRVWDDKEGEERLDQVIVLRAPETSVAADKRQQIWAELIPHLGGTGGWEVVDDPVSGRVRLRYGVPRRLLPRTTPADIGLEPIVRRDMWHHLPLGVNPEGQVLAFDLRSGPHLGVGGATGSGKSVSIRAILAGALLHGHDVVVIDPKKSCGDFVSFAPYAVAWGDDTLEQAADIMEAVYAEGGRRKAVLRSLGLPSIWHLSQAERDEHGIKPLLVVFDEFQAATIAKSVPKGIPADDPLMQRARSHNYAVARIQEVAQSGVLELRFVGIHFLFAGQVVSAEAFGSALRANLSSVLVCVPPAGGLPPKREILGMQFGDSAARASELIAQLNTRDHGLALTMGEDGNVDGCRVAFCDPAAIDELLAAAKLPEATRWEIKTSGGDADGQVIGGRAPKRRAVEPPIRDLDTLNVSLDDLEGLDDEDLWK